MAGRERGPVGSCVPTAPCAGGAAVHIGPVRAGWWRSTEDGIGEWPQEAADRVPGAVGLGHLWLVAPWCWSCSSNGAISTFDLLLGWVAFGAYFTCCADLAVGFPWVVGLASKGRS